MKSISFLLLVFGSLLLTSAAWAQNPTFGEYLDFVKSTPSSPKDRLYGVKKDVINSLEKYITTKNYSKDARMTIEQFADFNSHLGKLNVQVRQEFVTKILIQLEQAQKVAKEGGSLTLPSSPRSSRNSVLATEEEQKLKQQAEEDLRRKQLAEAEEEQKRKQAEIDRVKEEETKQAELGKQRKQAELEQKRAKLRQADIERLRQQQVELDNMLKKKQEKEAKLEARKANGIEAAEETKLRKPQQDPPRVQPDLPRSTVSNIESVVQKPATSPEPLRPKLDFPKLPKRDRASYTTGKTWANRDEQTRARDKLIDDFLESNKSQISKYGIDVDQIKMKVRNEVDEVFKKEFPAHLEKTKYKNIFSPSFLDVVANTFNTDEEIAEEFRRKISEPKMSAELNDAYHRLKTEHDADWPEKPARAAIEPSEIQKPVLDEQPKANLDNTRGDQIQQKSADLTRGTTSSLSHAKPIEAPDSESESHFSDSESQSHTSADLSSESYSERSQALSDESRTAADTTESDSRRSSVSTETSLRSIASDGSVRSGASHDSGNALGIKNLQEDANRVTEDGKAKLTDALIRDAALAGSESNRALVKQHESTFGKVVEILRKK